MMVAPAWSRSRGDWASAARTGKPSASRPLDSVSAVAVGSKRTDVGYRKVVARRPSTVPGGISPEAAALCCDDRGLGVMRCLLYPQEDTSCLRRCRTGMAPSQADA